MMIHSAASQLGDKVYLCIPTVLAGEQQGAELTGVQQGRRWGEQQTANGKFWHCGAEQECHC